MPTSKKAHELAMYSSCAVTAAAAFSTSCSSVCDMASAFAQALSARLSLFSILLTQARRIATSSSSTASLASLTSSSAACENEEG